MLQERINKISDYFKSIELEKGLIIIKMKYPPKWGVLKDENNRIKVAKSEDAPNEWFYWGGDNEISIDEIFDFVEETINMNLIAVKKVELLNQKFSELKELFAQESLENLETLQFILNKKKGRRKKQTSIDNEQIENKTEENINE